MKGILLVDKPAGMTSHDAVQRVRRAANMRRVGHTGTLDPSATGLLILCLGEATRLSNFLTGMDKTYEGVMRLGVSTDSYDLDGDIVEERPVPALDATAVQAECNRFIGAIEQVPPMVSAVKIGGERLYAKARKGEVVERLPRPVTVHEFSVRRYEAPDADFVLRCSSGTYARALCHEVGEAIGCGAALARLRRTAVGEHHVADAAPLDALESPGDVAAQLTPMGAALDLPAVTVRAGVREVVAHGHQLDRNDFTAECPVSTGWVQIKDAAGELLALGEAGPGQRVQPKRVLCKAS